ncbi:Outer membrane receptor protein, mostly Fe transport [Sesbania bispinosa]|nr:Outer membrane receptor protein, mostly Fe transport [Sesbania bispinosa]
MAQQAQSAWVKISYHVPKRQLKVIERRRVLVGRIRCSLQWFRVKDGVGSQVFIIRHKEKKMFGLTTVSYMKLLITFEAKTLRTPILNLSICQMAPRHRGGNQCTD